MACRRSALRVCMVLASLAQACGDDSAGLTQAEASGDVTDASGSDTSSTGMSSTGMSSAGTSGTGTTGTSASATTSTTDPTETDPTSSTTDGIDACAAAGGTCTCIDSCAAPSMRPDLDLACPQPSAEAGSCTMTCCFEDLGESTSTGGSPTGEPCGCYARRDADACVDDGGNCIWYPQRQHCAYALCGDLAAVECTQAKLCAWVDGFCYPPGECGA